jgi:hypothetical protein
VEHAGGGDPDPELVGILGMRHDVVQDETAAARHPLGPARVLGQTLDVLPGLAVVVADEQPGGLDPGIEPAMRPGQRPDGLELVLAVGIGEARVEPRPAQAPVGRAPDGGADPAVAAAGPERASCRIGDHVVDRLSVAEGAVEREGAAVGVALQDERTLAGGDQDEQVGRHRRTSFSRVTPAAGRSGRGDGPSP